MLADFVVAIRPTSPNAVGALEPGRRRWAEAAGLAGSSACIWLFSSTLKTIALSGGFR
jgi:hypothetical protein